MQSLNHAIKNRPTVSIWWCRFVASQVLVYSDYFQVHVVIIVDTYNTVQRNDIILLPHLIDDSVVVRFETMS